MNIIKSIQGKLCYIMGLFYMVLGKHSSVEKMWYKAYEITHDINMLKQLGTHYGCLKDYHQARSILEKAHNEFPNDPELYRLLVYALRALKDYEKAKQVLKDAIVLSPCDAQLHRMLVEILATSGASRQQLIPHIQAYFTYKPSKNQKESKLVNMFLKLIDLDYDWDGETKLDKEEDKAWETNAMKLWKGDYNNKQEKSETQYSLPIHSIKKQK